MALPGLGALQETLQETNTLLASVLDELRKTNDERLEAMRVELEQLGKSVVELVAAASRPS
jgi:hypothetical protein